MSAATVRLGDGTAIALDVLTGTKYGLTKGVLLTLEGRVPGDVLNCAVIPLDKLGAVMASLELVAKQARAS